MWQVCQCSLNRNSYRSLLLLVLLHPALFSADRSLANHFAVSFSVLWRMRYYMPIQQAGSLVQRTILHIATYTGKQFQMTGGRKEPLHCHQDRCNRIEEA